MHLDCFLFSHGNPKLLQEIHARIDHCVCCCTYHWPVCSLVTDLEELYLQHMNIRQISELSFLKNLKKLKILVLTGNPISPDYQRDVLELVPSLQKLDFQSILPWWNLSFNLPKVLIRAGFSWRRSSAAPSHSWTKFTCKLPFFFAQ